MAEQTTRAEHMTWCKARALECLPRDPDGALDSITSDLGKHEGTRDHPALVLTMMLRLGGHLSTADQVRKHIEGFN